MPVSFTGVVGALCVEKHCRGSHEADGRDEIANVSDVEAGEVDENVGCGEDEAVVAENHEQKDEADLQDPWIEKGPADVVAVASTAGILLNLFDEPEALGNSKPARVRGVIGKQKQKRDTERDGRQTFDEKEPLPPSEAETSLKTEERAGDGAHDGGAKRKRDIEAADCAGAHVRRKPLREVVDDSREEAGLGHSEEKAKNVKLKRRAHEHRGDGEDAPREEDAREPAARAESA